MWPFTRKQEPKPVDFWGERYEAAKHFEGTYYMRSDGVIVGPLVRIVTSSHTFPVLLYGSPDKYGNQRYVYSPNGSVLRYGSLASVPHRHLGRRVDKVEERAKPSTWTVRICTTDIGAHDASFTERADADDFLFRIVQAAARGIPSVNIRPSSDLPLEVLNPASRIQAVNLMEVKGEKYLAEVLP